MDKIQIVYGLESIIEENQHGPRTTKKEYRDRIKERTATLKSMVLAAKEKGYHQAIVSHHDDTTLKSNLGEKNEAIYQLERVDPWEKSSQIPFGIKYDEKVKARVIIGSPGIQYYPTTKNGISILVTDKLPFISNIELLEKLMEKLLLTERTSPEELKEKFDQLYLKSLSQNGSNAMGLPICNSRIISPYIPSFSRETRVQTDGEYIMQFGYSAYREKNPKIPNKEVRVVKIIHDITERSVK